MPVIVIPPITATRTTGFSGGSLTAELHAEQAIAASVRNNAVPNLDIE
jgi:hypothetical protein